LKPLQNRASGRARAAAAAIVAAVALAATANVRALTAGFCWDDTIMLTQQAERFTGLRSILVPGPNIPQWGDLYARPVVTASLLIDRAIWTAENPFGFHLPVYLSHLANTALVGALAWLVMRRSAAAPLAAGASAALFGVAPAHVEVVGWIAGRSDAYSTTFVLVALVLFIYHRQEGKRRPAVVEPVAWMVALVLALAAVAVFICFAKPGHGLSPAAPQILAFGACAGVLAFFALIKGGLGWADKLFAAVGAPAAFLGFLTKEPAVGVLGLFVLYDLVLGDRGAKSKPSAWRTIWPYTMVGLAAGAYFLYRAAAVRGALHLRLERYRSGYGVAADALVAVGHYMRVLVVPYPLNPYQWRMPQHAAYLGASGAAVCIVSGLAILAAFKGRRVAAFAAGWFALTLVIPLSNVYFYINEVPLADRYVYLPSAGFALAGGWLASAAYAALSRPPGRRRKAMVVVGTALAAVLAGEVALTARQMEVWQTDLALWTEAVRRSPDNGTPRLNLGTAALRRHKAEGVSPAESIELQSLAVANYKKALASAECPPKCAALANYNLAVMLVDVVKGLTFRSAEAQERGDAQDAEQLRLEAEERTAGIEAHVAKAVAFHPGFHGPHYARWSLYVTWGDYWLGAGDADRAKQAFRKSWEPMIAALERNPGSPALLRDADYTAARLEALGDERPVVPGRLRTGS